ncbi:hypothetical protein E8K88_13045 [Lampropedia aestuarii]|uniref:Chalcone isomerase domain-containing protein n=1 Tax=Lampropedia aestuarii TaxID=2562762 RepID=A0A4S5BQR8_9BURK|nr:chalcone isomerase family protein [Lampropedia aestuarii]THJ32168.1 hypothetical protein E8K88_13045 [Lampropedia aestuarii]
MHRRQLLACVPALALLGQQVFASQELASQQNAAPVWAANLPQARLLGEGDFRWFGMRIYRAQLWVSPSWPTAPASSASPAWQQQPLVLHIAYYRTIERAQFVQATMQEIERLYGEQFSDQRLAEWASALTAVWRDVQQGDVLSAWYQPGDGCRFYDQHVPLGELADAEFADAFFSIWLHPQARDGRLRRQLLGLA